MAIAAVNPNIEYARPLVISSEPVNAYLRRRQWEQQNTLSQERLGLQEASLQQKLDRQRQNDMETRMKQVANLGKYDMGGLWHNEQEQAIENYQKELTKKIENDDPNWQEYAIKTATQLEGNRQKANTYDNLLKEKISEYSKDNSIDPARFAGLWIGKTAYNADGTLKDINDLNLNNVMTFNPLTDPDFDKVVNNAALTDKLIKLFPKQTKEISTTNRTNGITNSENKILTSSSYTRIDPLTGTQTLNVEALNSDPVLQDHFFDPYRTKSGQVDLIKDNIYQTALQEPQFRYKVFREIARHNAELSPNDADYIETNSPDADMVGRAVLTGMLTGRENGNFHLKRIYAQNKNTANGNSISELNSDTDGLVKRLKGVADQQAQYVDHAPQSNLDMTSVGLGKYGNIKDVSSFFSNVNMEQNEKGKSVPQSGIYVSQQFPGKIFINHNNGELEIVDKEHLPAFINKILTYNPKLNAVKINKQINNLFGAQNTSQVEDNNSSGQQPPPKNIIQKAFNKIKGVIEKIKKPSLNNTDNKDKQNIQGF